MTGAAEANHALISREEFDRLFEAVKNWGRWGPDDERGTLNYITPEHVRAAAALVRSGQSVSLAVPIRTEVDPENPRPALHYMIHTREIDTGEPRWNQDFIGIEYHGESQSHIDALCHCLYRDQLYNHIPPTSVTSKGASRGGIGVAEHGIVGRGVLLDIPRLRGVAWLEPGTAVTTEELEAAETAQGLQVGEGDILLLRTGHHRRRVELGPWPSWESSSSLHVRAMLWLHQRRVSALGADSDNEVNPSPVECLVSPIHALAIPAMGMHLLDTLQLEDLATLCAAEHRWAFQLVVAPLRLPVATGSPVNPIAIF